MSAGVREESVLARIFGRTNTLPRLPLDWLTTSVFHVELAKSGVAIDIRPLGLVGKYVALELSVSSAQLSSSEIEQALKAATGELEEKGIAEYVDLVKDGVGETFLKGFTLGLRNPGAVLVHYHEHYNIFRREDPIILLIDTSSESRLQETIEALIKTLDKALEPIKNTRDQLRETLKKLKEIVKNRKYIVSAETA